jgi:outer membrane autotransporter protein
MASLPCLTVIARSRDVWDLTILTNDSAMAIPSWKIEHFAQRVRTLGEAQNRRDPPASQYNVFGAPSFSPYRFAFRIKPPYERCRIMTEFPGKRAWLSAIGYLRLHCTATRCSVAIPGTTLVGFFFVRFPSWFSLGSVASKSRLILFGVLMIGSSALYGQVDTWQSSGDGSWFTRTNWSLGVPTPTQDALVDNGTVALIGPHDGEATAFNLTIGTTVPGSTVQLAGNNLTVRTLFIGTGGTFLFSGGLLFLTGPQTITDNGAIVFQGSFNQFLAANVVGSGKLVIDITGTLSLLSSNNTYNGATILTAGTLQVNSTGALSLNSAFTVNSILDLNGFDSTIGSLSGTGSVINGEPSGSPSPSPVGPATLTVGNDNSNSTFSGVIEDGTGVLQLTKIGAGTLTLTGANTYSGGTTVSAGTLQLGNGGTTGSIVGNVVDDGILAFNRSDVFTFGGVISGTGSVRQIGSGTTVLTGANSYTGGTTIADGTLQLGSGGTSGSISGNVIDNGRLAFNRSDVLTFSGAISGTGGVTQIGPGTTILAGNNSYAGATTIASGTIQAGSANGLSQNSAFTVNSILDLNGFSNTIGSLSGTGTVLNNGTTSATLTAGASNGDSTFSGVLADGTSVLQLVKSGSGALTLTGSNTYTGATTVNGGSLIVDGSIASVQALVKANGLLGGRGLIGGNVTNSGIVSPGDSPGTLTVSGNYSQSSTGTLRIEIAGLGVGQHDLLAVGGHATLGGTLQLIRLGAFQLQPGDKITFLTASGGVSGNFSTIQNDFATIVKTQVIISPNAVVLEGTQGSFAAAACNSNTAAVGQALDNAVGDPRATALINFLNGQPINQLCSDFTLIAPEQLTSVFNIAVSFANVQTANLERRTDEIRGGSTGFSSSGFTMNGNGPGFSAGLGGPTGAEGKSGPSVVTPIPENRWGIFVTGLGEFTHVDSTDIARGFDVQTGGFTVGVDYRIGSNFAVGLISGYAHTNADLANGGDLDANSAKFGLYGTAFSGPLYLDTAITGGWSGYDTRRSALLGTASGSTDGADLNFLVNAGYDWKKGGLTIGPTASFQYTYVNFNGFTETGSLAPLTLSDQHVDSIRTAFGMKASYDWHVGHVIIRPELRAAWQHEYGDSAYSITAKFASGAGSSFSVSSPTIGRDSLLLGAGAAVQLNDRISIYAYYDGELARTNYESNTVTAGVRITF